MNSQHQVSSAIAPSQSRTITQVISAFRTLEGDSVPIRRAIPSKQVEAVGPFIFLDHIGPITFAPGKARGAPNHPHRGFETLTYLLEGRGEHRDSLGNVSVIGPGEAQWMRAGSGILHDEGADEVLRREGGRVHGVQFWINLPQGRKMSPPAYRHLARTDIPEIAFDDATMRLLAGEFRDTRGPVETFANPWLAHVAITGGKATLTLPTDGEFAIYVATGTGQFAANKRLLREGELALLAGSGSIEIIAETPLDIFVLGGTPLDAPIRRYGPFVMNTDAELNEAVRDFQAGKFGVIPQ